MKLTERQQGIADPLLLLLQSSPDGDEIWQQAIDLVEQNAQTDDRVRVLMAGLAALGGEILVDYRNSLRRKCASN